MIQFDSQPFLEGKLVKIHPLLDTDFEELFAVSSDPLIWEMHPEKNRYQRETFEKFFKAALESKGAMAVLDASNNKLIGSSRFLGFDEEKNRVEIGYTFLARAYWGRGYNRELKKLMLEHAFKYVENIFFYVGAKNMRSRRAMEKIGATLVERIERNPAEGSGYGAVVFRLQKKEYNLS